MIGLKYLIRDLFNTIGADVSRFPQAASQMIWLKELNINTIVDVGANLGQFVKKIVKVLPHSKVLCFEPLPEEFQKLKRIFKNNPNFSIKNYALGNSTGKMYFHKSKFSPSSSVLNMSDIHKFNFPFTSASIQIEVMMEKLDNFLSEIDPDEKTLVKIDVQGYESEVISGGEQVIRKSKVLLIEVSFRELYNGQKLFDDLYPRLRELGYRYKGSFNNVYSNLNGEILQGDSVFVKE